MTNSTANLCLWRSHDFVLDFMHLSAMRVAETAEHNNWKGCPPAFGQAVYMYRLWANFKTSINLLGQWDESTVP